MRRLVTLTVCALFLLALAPTAQASFGFKPGKEGFAVSIKTEEGKPSTAAGSHPHEWSLHLGFKVTGAAAYKPRNPLRSAAVRVPPGHGLE